MLQLIFGIPQVPTLCCGLRTEDLQSCMQLSCTVVSENQATSRQRTRHLQQNVVAMNNSGSIADSRVNNSQQWVSQLNPRHPSSSSAGEFENRVARSDGEFESSRAFLQTAAYVFQAFESGPPFAAHSAQLP